MPEVRLIDAEALLRDNGLCDAVRYENMNAEQRKKSFSTMRLYEIAEMIEMQPTIEAEPVRHGRWIEDGEICGIYKYKCSLCGGEVGGLLDNTKYCCFCGAKMDGGAENG